MKTYSYGEWMDELAVMIRKAAGEMDRICTESLHTLEGHLDSYNLLETLWLLDNFKEQTELLEKKVDDEEFQTLKDRLEAAIALYRETYREKNGTVRELYRQDEMEKLAETYMAPWKDKVTRAEKRLEKMKSLHTLATRASEVFQGHNFIRKQLILNKLRKEAGFRLERKRVCNFAAKTFDLLNEAQSDLNLARNGLHNSNVTYKCIGDLYDRIYRELDHLSAILTD